MATIIVSPTGGNYNSTAAWVGGVIPTNADDIAFLASSGNLVINGDESTIFNACRNIDFTSYVGTLSAISGGGTLGVYGSCTFASTMGVNINNTLTFSFRSTSAGNTITWATPTTSAFANDFNMSFNGTGGSWQFTNGMASYWYTTFVSINLLDGTLDFNGKTVNAYRLQSFTGGTKTLTTGSATINVNATYSLATDTTLNSGTSSITFAGAQFHGGALTYRDVILTPPLSLGTAQVDIYDANTFTNLTLTGAAGRSIFVTRANQTISGTLAANGNNAAGNRAIILTDAPGTQRTLTVNTTVTATYLDLEDIVGAGSASWDLSAITGKSSDHGNNSGITFTTPITAYWFKDTGNYSDGTKWFLATNGGGGAARVPLAQDTALFDSHSFSTSTRVVTLDMPAGNIDFTGSTNNPKITLSSLLKGNVTLISGMVAPTSGTFTFSGGKNTTFTSAGVGNRAISIDKGAGTVTLQDPYTTVNTLTMTSGILDTNSQVTVVGAVTQTGGTINATGASFSTSPSSGFTQTGGIFNGAGQTITSASGLSLTTGTFIAGGLVLATLSSIVQNSGTLTIGSGGVTAKGYSSSNTGVRTLNMGSGTWNMVGTGTVWATGTTTNLTFNPQTSKLYFSDTSSTTKSFSGGNLTFNNVEFAGAAGAGALTITSSNTFNDFKVNPSSNVKITSGTTQTISSFSGKGSAGFPAVISSSSSGSKATLSSSAIIHSDYLSLQDNFTSGTGAFFAGAHSTNVSNNSGWVFAFPTFASVTGVYTTTGVGPRLLRTRNPLQPAAGAYTVTGIAAKLEHGYIFQPSVGSYTYTGVAATFTHTQELKVPVGTYSLTGNTANIFASRKESVSAGSYTVTGVAAKLEHGYEGMEAVGIYTYTGVNAILKAARKESITVGSYTYTGVDPSVRKGRSLAISAGSYTYTGVDAIVKIDRKSSILNVTYAYTGITTTLRYDHPIHITAGSYTYTGVNALLEHNQFVNIPFGQYTVTGQNPNLKHGFKTFPVTGTYTLTGKPIIFQADYPMHVSAGVYTYTGVNPRTEKGYKVSVPKGTYTMTNFGPLLTKQYKTFPVVGNYNMTGVSVQFKAIRHIIIPHGVYTLTGINPILQVNFPMHVSAGAYTFTGGKRIFLQWGHTVHPATGAYAYTGIAVSHILRRLVTGDAGHYHITKNNAVLGAGRKIHIDTGAYTLLGTAQRLLKGKALHITTASFVYAGQSANTFKGFTVEKPVGVYTVQTNNVSLRANRKIVALPAGV